MTKREFAKEWKHLYAPSTKEVSEVVVPAMNFLMLDGEGNPNTSPTYQAVLEALYGLSYGLKFKIKKLDPALDYTVMPLEGLWWAPDMGEFVNQNKDSWLWTMMIMQPDEVTPALLDEARAEARRKRPSPLLDQARLERFEEGRSAQLMHIGPFANEGPNIARIHAYIKEGGHSLRGKHHEIYLSDPRRVPAEKFRTVIRQPFE